MKTVLMKTVDMYLMLIKVLLVLNRVEPTAAGQVFLVHGQACQVRIYM